MWKPRVERNRVFSKPHFFHVRFCIREAGRDILWCASLTRTLRATSEDMALMTRVLHTAVWSREGPGAMAAPQPTHPGVYPYRARSTEFRMYTRRGLAGSVLIGGGKIRMHRAYISSQRLLSWLSGFSQLVIWQQSPGCSTDAVEKDWIWLKPFWLKAFHPKQNVRIWLG